MSTTIPVQSSPGFSVGDIYHVLFRHKWRILICSVLGVCASVAVYKLRPASYHSEAKLFIKYVETDRKAAVGPPGRGDAAKSPDQRGETIMTSEMEILMSTDLARYVAEQVGPEKILAKLGGGNDLARAALVVRKNLAVSSPSRTTVIRIAFQHPDPTVVQPVVREVIDRYFQKHREVHRSAGTLGNFLSQETDQLRARLAQMEEDLRKAKLRVGVISVEDAKKFYTDQTFLIMQELRTAQAELAERTSVLEEITRQTRATNQPASSDTTEGEPLVSNDVVEEYRNIVTHVTQLRRTVDELRTRYTDENNLVQQFRGQLAEAEASRKKLEQEHPSLTRTAPVVSASNSTPTAQVLDPNVERARIASLRKKIEILNSQLEEMRREAGRVDQLEAEISDMRRNKEMIDSHYRYYSASLEQSRVDEALGAGRISNIISIQEPSPPFADLMKIYKLAAMVAAAGIGGGLAWSFLIEMYLDRTLKRAVDVQRILPVPMFLSVPDVSRNRRRSVPSASRKRQLQLGSADASEQVQLSDRKSDPGHSSALYPFYATLRDRLIAFFESRNLTHKPKLVAVTSIGSGAGVTTTAAGLAQSLSETGEGNVLLVDMTLEQGSAQHFVRGKALCGLDEMFDTRDNAHVQEKLYVVAESANSDRLYRNMPQRFTKLVPRLKASDFDYIIFDMPPVSQISITPRLASFMDMVLFVVESEKTDQDLAQKATALLMESKAHVGVVLNKTRTYVPSRLHKEFLGTM